MRPGTKPTTMAPPVGSLLCRKSFYLLEGTSAKTDLGPLLQFGFMFYVTHFRSVFHNLVMFAEGWWGQKYTAKQVTVVASTFKDRLITPWKASRRTQNFEKWNHNIPSALLSKLQPQNKSESGFIGQVSLHKQGIWLGKVSLSVLTQNIHHNTKQYKQCNGLRSLKKVFTGAVNCNTTMNINCQDNVNELDIVSVWDVETLVMRLESTGWDISDRQLGQPII